MIRPPGSLYILVVLVALDAVALASCSGGPKGRPTLPPPDYEMPSTSPDASDQPSGGPTAPAVPFRPVPAPPPSAALGAPTLHGAAPGVAPPPAAAAPSARGR